MKKYGLLLAILLVVTLLMGVVACETVDGAVIGVDNTLSRTFRLEVRLISPSILLLYLMEVSFLLQRICWTCPLLILLKQENLM